MTKMSLLEAPEARSLLKDATVEASEVAGCRGRVERLMRRYLPLFYREEQRENATLVIRGLLSGLERKTCEPIARAAGVARKPVQFFVGNGKWDDEAVMAELRKHVAEELGDPGAVVVIDGSTFVKKGKASCGVGRQWCGRLGKVENCQTGVFLTYAAAGGHALVDRRLYLPKDWTGDDARRKQCHVPEKVVFEEKWRMALEMIREHGSALPHGWITGDDEFGRVVELRRLLRERGEHYVLDVPCTTPVRDLEQRRPPRRSRRLRKVPFVRIDAWAKKQRPEKWQRLKLRDSEQGPVMVEAITRRVATRDEKRRRGPEERAVVIRTLGEHPVTDYCLSDAGPDVPLSELVRVHGQRHGIEEVLQEGKQEVGLAHYEVRSWTGWHHHMTLSLLASWFLTLERERVGKKNPGVDGLADAPDIHVAVASAAAYGARDCRHDHAGVAAQRNDAYLQVACRHRRLPATTAA